MSEAPHPTDVRVGQLLKQRRLQLGISQERLGAMLGVTYQQVQKYERGTNRIGSSRLQDLCRILGVRASYFIHEADVAEASPGLAEQPAATFDFARDPGDPLGRESQELMVAFRGIADPEVRRHLLAVARALARTGAYRNTGGT